MGSSPVLFALLLHSVKRAKTRITCCRKNHVGAFANLSQRKLLALSWIVPGAVGNANVILDDADVGIDGFGSFFVAFLETVNQANIHAPEKADSPRFGGFRRQHPDKIGAFVLLEHQRGNIRHLAYTIDNSEVDVRVVLGNLFHYGRLSKTHPNNQIEPTFGEGSHCRFNRVWSARFYVTQHDREIPGCPLHTFPSGCVEGTIVFSADVKNDPYMNFCLVVSSVTLGVTRGDQERQHTKE